MITNTVVLNDGFNHTHFISGDGRSVSEPGACDTCVTGLHPHMLCCGSKSEVRAKQLISFMFLAQEPSSAGHWISKNTAMMNLIFIINRFLEVNYGLSDLEASKYLWKLR